MIWEVASYSCVIALYDFLEVIRSACKIAKIDVILCEYQVWQFIGSACKIAFSGRENCLNAPFFSFQDCLTVRQP